jgi:OOP family OmpA-OmpF porin
MNKKEFWMPSGNQIQVIVGEINRSIVLVFLLFLFLPLQSQNLVPNPSFEDYIDFSGKTNSGWHKIQNTDTPDYFNFDRHKPVNNVFDKYTGGTQPKTGNAFVGFFCLRSNPQRNVKNVREYIGITLLSPLEKDSLYKVEISLCLDAESNAAVKNFGLIFSANSLEFNKDYQLFAAKPQIEFSLSYPDKNAGWITVSAFYKASGNEKFIIIGNFRTDKATVFKKLPVNRVKGKDKKWDLQVAETAAYYYVDDVIIEKTKIEKAAMPVEQKIIKEKEDTLNLDKIEIDSAIILKNILFEFNKTELLPESYTEINILLRLLTNNPQITIKLEGHTDNLGSYDFNIRLSVARAESVVRYLIEKGIDPHRIEYAGYGFTQPLATNDTEESRKINRRVTFKIISK